MIHLFACAVPFPESTFVGDPRHDFDGDGYTEADGDCDDADVTRFPGNVEVCDTTDNDCDDLADEADEGIDPASLVSWYVDLDGDGWGDDARLEAHCADAALDALWVRQAGDCDDTDADVHPDGAEICGDGLDNDCDGEPGDCGWPSSISLADASVVLTATDAEDRPGWALAGDADADGDGFADVLIGVPEFDAVAGDEDHGLVALWRGGSEPPSSGALAEVEDRIAGIDEKGRFGTSVAFVADLDGDELPEVLVGGEGAVNSPLAAGAAWLFASPVTGTLTSDLAVSSFLGGEVGSATGRTVADGGDLGGQPTLVIGATDEEATGLLHLVDAGLAALGTLSGGQADADLARTGLSVADLDGDGVSDLIAGAPGWNVGGVELGAAAILFGPLTGDHDLADRADVLLVGATVGDNTGRIASAGTDLDDDGLPDLLVAADLADVDGHADAGSVSVVLAGELADGERILSELAAFRISGTDADDECGKGTAFAGDFGGDPAGDLAVGAPGWSGAEGGLFVFLGPLPVGGTTTIAEADHTFAGALADRHAGWTVAGAGDLDRNGFDDLATSAPAGGPTETPGAVYLLFGDPGI